MRLWFTLHAQAAGAALGRVAAQPLATISAVLVIAIAIALPVLAAVAKAGLRGE